MNIFKKLRDRKGQGALENMIYGAVSWMPGLTKFLFAELEMSRQT